MFRKREATGRVTVHRGHILLVSRSIRFLTLTHLVRLVRQGDLVALAAADEVCHGDVRVAAVARVAHTS